MLDFQEKYEADIIALADEKLNLNIDGYFNGVVAAVEGRKLLVINGVSKEEIINLDINTILKTYDNYFWFTFEQDVFVEVGSTINVVYKNPINENLATGLFVELLSE